MIGNQHTSLIDKDIAYSATNPGITPPWHRQSVCLDFESALRECISEGRQRVIVEQCTDCGQNIGFSQYSLCKTCLPLTFAENDCKQNKRLINKLNKALSHGED